MAPGGYAGQGKEETGLCLSLHLPSCLRAPWQCPVSRCSPWHPVLNGFPDRECGSFPTPHQPPPTPEERLSLPLQTHPSSWNTQAKPVGWEVRNVARELLQEERRAIARGRPQGAFCLFICFYLEDNCSTILLNNMNQP